MHARLQGFDPPARATFADAAGALAAGKPELAEAGLRELLRRYPDHPDTLHLAGALRARRGDHAGALAALRRAWQLRPDDAALCCTLGSELALAGDLDGALAVLRRACTVQPGLAAAWYDLGVLAVRAVRFEEADAALRRALALDPGHLRARVQLADLVQMEGRTQAAIDLYRGALAQRPTCGDAWWGLAGLREAGLDGDDVLAMQAALEGPEATADERVALGFALARRLDALGQVDAAMAALHAAHARAQRLQPWYADVFERSVDAILAAFAPTRAADAAPRLGNELIFIVGLPRSGSTLAEQILGAHSQVAASGELHALSRVLAEESARRRRAYPTWAGSMTGADWQRLGRRYLERTARWRRDKPRSIDKLPGNWLHVGAIRAMLPAAKVIACRRNPLETCFACYRRRLAAEGLGWTHRFADLAAYWHAFDRALRHWDAACPGFVHPQVLEALVADPESSVRALLDFCGLPFEAGCLAFGARAGVVRSPSAAQVRQPLQHDIAHAPRYGALLDPLRDALAAVGAGDKPDPPGVR